MDEGDDGVNFQLRRRLGLHGLLGTLLVPQPCEDARLDLLSHLHNLSFFLLFSLSRNRVLNLTVCAGASSECQRSTACTGGGLGVCWWGEQQGSLARSGALFYARGLVKCAGWTRRISPEKQGGQWRSAATAAARWSILWGTGARGCGEARGGHRPTVYDVRDGVAPACLRPVRAHRGQRSGGPGRRLRRARPRSAGGEVVGVVARAVGASGPPRRHGSGGRGTGRRRRQW